MKLTILGSGTVVPSGARNSSGYFVEAPGARVMLDCGAGTLHALSRYGVDWQAMTHIFLSHFHVDHVGELASLFFAFRHAMKKARHEKLSLIAPRGASRLLNHLREAFGEKLFTPKFPFELIEVEPGESVRLSAECSLSVYKTPHTDESLAARIQTTDRAVCYTGDTDFSEELAGFFGDTTLLLSECSFKERKAGVKHLAVADVARLAQLSRAARLVVTHFYFEVDDEELTRELQKGYTGEVIIGRDGLSIEV